MDDQSQLRTCSKPLQRFFYGQIAQGDSRVTWEVGEGARRGMGSTRDGWVSGTSGCRSLSLRLLHTLALTEGERRGPTQTRTIALIDLRDLSQDPPSSATSECDPRKMTIEEEDKKDGSEEKHEEEEVCPAAAHLDKFDPAAYLESFYKTASEDTAMQIVLFFLPGILYRLPRTVRTALDLGAGPTVYIPIAMRSQAVQMFTSDYARVNRDVLQSWIEDKSAFDWSNVCRWISNIEAAAEEPAVMQQKAREKVDAVLEVCSCGML
ncbi:hypothetical protein Y032_0015g2608 [Ancylostoma ceylanicum]|uniref:NNMT/PNMT/TEMT family protein n=1 Tax=Ancylostoma ceylanicum TaxID=53326 RepID=A0A016V7V2_9BILA|nr:hypothetical protein Y032_0015g2608 [Ancylostoma ceylanicum]